MADSILKIRTQDGDKPIGYPGLADKPVADKTLEIEGAFADSKEVGERFAKVNETTDSLKEDLGDFISDSGIEISRQYLSDSDRIEGKYYWDNTANGKTTIEIADNPEYAIYPSIKRLKAGTYYITSNASQTLTIAIALDGSTFKKITQEEISNGIITIDYDFDIYITCLRTQSNVMFANNMLPSTYQTGEYGITYSNVDVKKLDANVKELRNQSLNIPKIFKCGSKQKYTKLKDAIAEAIKYNNSYVYVDAETFDLVEEYGQDYLDSYDGREFGIHLANDVHVIFDSGAKVVFDYKGSNAKVHEFFSPFNATYDGGGFELINAWVESKNCRYSVHDEHASDSVPYKQIYRHCTFIHDSSECSWGAHQAIGGGLGQHGDIVVEDCYGKSVGTSQVFSWHQATDPNYACKSNIVVKGCYLEGYVEFGILGQYSDITNIYVHGNSLTSKPVTTLNPGVTNNMKLMEWNNEIRS